jgi:radical SAM superfamily enzyme YgiQ (UPF0313 family)
MKILLVAINSKYIHSNLAVYSLKAYYDHIAGFDKSFQQSHTEGDSPVEIAEYTINQLTDEIIAGIYKKRPDVIAFSCYIWNITKVYEVAVELNKILPDVPIWLGGPEVTYDSVKELKEHSYITGVMIGEGEQTFSELCEYYQNTGMALGSSDELRQILQIAFRDEKDLASIIKTPNRPLLSMDDLPFVYTNMEAFQNKIIYYESSRGCPFGCSYCLSSVEKSVRFRSLDKVFKELQYFLDVKVSQVKFVDRTFNCNHDRTLKLFAFILEHDNGITNFHFEIAADLLKQDEIDILKQMRPGLVQLEIGVQSANLDTIHEIDRVMNLEELSSVVNEIHEGENVHEHLDLIAGLPHEDLVSFQKSFDYVYNLKPEQLQLGFLKVLKGSKMHQKALEYGIVYQNRPPYEVLYTKWLSYEDVLTLKRVEDMVENYYNSRLFVNTMDYLSKQTNSPYSLYAKLANYYEINGLFEIKHTRITRYRILYDFMKEYLNEQADSKSFEIARERLIFDLYLRENLKTRPDFAIHGRLDEDAEEDKNVTRQLYQLCNAPKNAHLEHFTIDIESLTATKVPTARINGWTEQAHKGTWILFNYDTREPLNYNATITWIQGI